MTLQVKYWTQPWGGMIINRPALTGQKPTLKIGGALFVMQ